METFSRKESDFYGATGLTHSRLMQATTYDLVLAGGRVIDTNASRTRLASP
jgi:hypothetical protein